MGRSLSTTPGEYSADVVIKVCGCPSSHLKDLLRPREGRQPIYTPSQPSEGRGHWARFSFRDLMNIASLMAVREIGLERRYLAPLAALSVKMQTLRLEADPTDVGYLKAISGGRTRELEYLLSRLAPTVTLSLLPTPAFVVWRCSTTNWTSVSPRKSPWTHIEGAAPWDDSPIGLREFKDLDERSIGFAADETPFSISVNLNKIHYNVRRKLTLEGID